MVPPPSVVVVVVVVLDVCAQANGAATASAMLSNVFFIRIPFRSVFPFHANAGRQPSRTSRRVPLYCYFESDGPFGPFVRNIVRHWSIRLLPFEQSDSWKGADQ